MCFYYKYDALITKNENINKILNISGNKRLINNQLRFTTVNEAFGAAKEVKLGGLEKTLIVLGIFVAASFRILPSLNRVLVGLQGINYGYYSTKLEIDINSLIIKFATNGRTIENKDL